MDKFVILLILSVVYLSEQEEIINSKKPFVYSSNNFSIKVEIVNQKALYTVQKFGKSLQQFNLGDRFKLNPSATDIENGFVLHGLDQEIEFKVVENSDDFSLVKVSTSLRTDQNDTHCASLLTGTVHWFGGPELSYKYWPIEKNRFQTFSYVPQQMDNACFTERYWLNSLGVFIHIGDRVPLFINQNVNNNTLCFIVQNKLPYNVRREKIEFVYNIGVGRDAKVAQMKAVKFFLKKPTAVPDRRMVEHPIWSTWVKYKTNINATTVMKFASQIEKYGFKNSQLEIDDDWEVCYGSLTFKDTKFPNIRNLTDSLRARGFRVTLWIHPFINKKCEPWYSEAKNNGYLVLNHKGNPDTQWWNSDRNGAGYIDFTKPEAAEWFQGRLKKLQKEAGIDSFKFDAGELHSRVPEDPKLNTDLEDHPLAIVKSYIRAVSIFGPIVEVRAGSATQDLPIFVRMMDKDSTWTYRNGLPTLVTTLLQMNLVGYSFILPDMIGGNGYKQTPSEELFIRWLQASVFMPSLQYSYVPWDYSEKALNISKKFTNLHTQYAGEVMKAFENVVKTGEPVNPPIWWLDPQDKVALGINDEYLLGNRILAAPIVNKGEEYRHIYLPKGKWFDPNLNRTYFGPRWLMEYPARIEVLPYFIRDENP